MIIGMRGLTSAPSIATGVLSLLLGLQLAWLLTGAFGPHIPPRPTQTSIKALTEAPETTERYASVIAKAEFFGPEEAKEASPPTPTNLPLVLAGVLARQDPAAGFAIVGENTSAARFYAVGSSLSNGVKLQAVYADYIVIEHDGRLETLLLPSQIRTGKENPSVIDLGTANWLEKASQMTQNNPASIGEIIRWQQVLQGGKVRGFRLYPGNNAFIFTELGLRPGDLVVAVNQSPIDEGTRGEEILRTLGSSARVNLTLQRDNRRIDISLDMAEAIAKAQMRSSNAPILNNTINTDGNVPMDITNR